ncbi:transglutaminase-like domain-containing protein [Arthrospira platensis]|jgi:transglutaminase-like putative cysteine protease|uniref:Transglutaminase-like domain protein n=1 Tax=Limnospira platensis NIES-46 TaxID=1236695 RepID=A0A5M3TFK9_LIMPL|nr:transglutaminase family protein [Arthrospira platensis]AMW30275.1 transglutaminase [Arthrospira platensis YZ]MBD2671661.1 transglutaminase family protein [Arthrospira platensis FACHB-439]MBD2712595.1 transglutaminase family protein [Arthrospira platensis FACHB-835]MDF2207811.1 transglutaminase family protein [Arthrospira platensis NCB002]MDT9185404.1 transglutaminase family protein [Limnospira sp. PMC 289.06]MDT9297579.1 transglutaminase family protein [Arthrospira platensis PCC 7345]QQW2
MKFNLGCQLNYEIYSDSTLIFNIAVCNNRFQQILQEDLHIAPDVDIDEYISPELENRYIRVNSPPGNLEVSYQATVEFKPFEEHPQDIPEVPPAKLPLDVLPYLYPSRYCESDRLMRFAQTEFGDLVPDYSRVTAMCNWIYENVTYLSGSTNAHTSAFDTATERAGVCRDFAHLGIAFCRSLNIPARFVTGYAYDLQPPDFHAYFEAYLGDRWYLFDATRLVPRTGLIRIGTGRDAADVSFATIFGSVFMSKMELFVDCISPGECPIYTEEAIAFLE